MNLRALGIDLSTRTGLALAEISSKLPTPQEPNPGLKIIEGTEFTFDKITGLERADHIGQYILEYYNTHKPQIVVIEGYGYANAHSLATLVEIGTVVRYSFWQLGIEMIEVSPTQLKKFVTGAGNSAKDKVMMEVYKRWGYTAKTNNIADAVVLAMIGACISTPSAFTNGQNQVAQAVRKAHIAKHPWPAPPAQCS